MGASLQSLVRGSIGSPDALLSATFVRASPLLLTGLAVALSFRSGVFNIGAEGQLVVGAAAATFVAIRAEQWLDVWTVPVELAAAAAAGIAWAIVPAWLRRRFRVPEVITTIMMNFLATFLVSYLVRGPLQEPTRVYPQSSTFAELARIPTVHPMVRLHWGFVLAILLALFLGWALRHTASGFRIIAVGVNPRAAEETGRIDVDRLTWLVFLGSGALAGLAGGIEVGGVTYALYDNVSPGYGYTAIAVALLAGLQPVMVVPSAILFGGLSAGAAAMQRDVAVPAGFVEFVQALIILALLAAPHIVAFMQQRLARLQAVEQQGAR